MIASRILGTAEQIAIPRGVYWLAALVISLGLWALIICAFLWALS